MKNDIAIYPVVAKIWCEILGVERAQPTDTFVDHGGTSIAAEKIASRIYDELSVDMRGGEVLRRATLSSLVDLVVSRLR